ncbi:hypothetical protein E1B28_011451 [Marasmius oreades]|uniref:UBA domain-containing protein n=1 Tax=Marasmius oreades TaxID=181124 RepID=A0A9P7RU35_9AGAR|nr:uncharacterized protein E1B28_011451 [Marasmius oreades]KAG7089801.1 hypothetical protein E1B28_011451 [Marasmius oreades]
MLSHARNVTIHDGNFGIVHGNQYIKKYNAPISKRPVTHAYGDTFNNSTVRRTTRDTCSYGQVGSQSPDSQSAIFLPRMPLARFPSSCSHISIRSLPKSDHSDSASSNFESSVLHTPTESTRHNIGYPTHPGATPTCSAGALGFEHHNSSSFRGNERQDDPFIESCWNSNEMPQNNEIPLFNLAPHAPQRPISACSEHTNDSRKQTLGITTPAPHSRYTDSRLGSPRSSSPPPPAMCGTRAWLRQTETLQDDRPFAASHNSTCTEQPTIFDQGARMLDCRNSDYAPSEATSFYRIPSELNWDADDEHESQLGSERGTVSPSKVRGLINHIVEMGFTRREVVRCMRASNNDPDLAVEYLMNGIPNGLRLKSKLH